MCAIRAKGKHGTQVSRELKKPAGMASLSVLCMDEPTAITLKLFQIDGIHYWVVTPLTVT